MSDRSDEQVLAGGNHNSGSVVRIGDCVHRPRRPGFEVVEAMLLHLETVGYELSPRFHGIDDAGRQVVDFIVGEVSGQPPWQLDDELNAKALGDRARSLRALHDATHDFGSPPGSESQLPCPAPGDVWTHGDVGYNNTVYADLHMTAGRCPRIVGLIDWEFVQQGARAYDLATMLGMETRAPRPGAADPDGRPDAVKLAMHAIVTGYGLAAADVAELPGITAIALEGAADFWRANFNADDETIDRLLWKAAWFRDQADWLLS